MSETNVRLYEGLFLLSASASGDLAGSLEFVKQILDRAESEILSLRKWDDRKLAYAINGQKRGTYILAYFKCRGTQIANIERDCNLSDQIARVLIIKADHIGETEIELERKEAVERSVESSLRRQDDDSDDTPETPDTTEASVESDDADSEASNTEETASTN